LQIKYSIQSSFAFLIRAFFSADIGYHHNDSSDFNHQEREIGLKKTIKQTKFICVIALL